MGYQNFKGTCCLVTPFNLVAVYQLCELTVAIYCLQFHRHPVYILSHLHLRLLHPEIWGRIFLRNVAVPIPDGVREVQFYFSTVTRSMTLK
jgi:hypothetical protein